MGVGGWDGMGWDEEKGGGMWWMGDWLWGEGMRDGRGPERGGVWGRRERDRG